MERSSDQTRYYRFFGPMKRLSDKDLHRFTHVDHDDRVAFVVLLGDQIIAVGRYDRYPGTDDAEVAFLVEDAHQGRGLGSVLLEHLAAAARERGIKPLRRRGAGPEQQDGAGLPRRRLPVRALLRGRRRPPDVPDRPDRGRPRRRLRAGAAQRVPVDRAGCSTPSSVAVVGASNDEGKIGNALLEHLLDYGFAGPVYPVNPRRRHVRGVPAYADIESIPDDVDLAVLAVPADEVAAVVEACRRKRVRGLVVVSGGFGETGSGRAAPPSGSWSPPPARRACGSSAPTAWASSTPTPRCGSTPASPRWSPAAGGSASSPSPARSASPCSSAPAAATSGCPRFVSAGNRADVSGNDLLQYWATDPATEVVLLYLESFGNPRKFARLARTRRPHQAGRGGEERAARARSPAGWPARR